MVPDDPSGARPGPVVLRIKLRYDDVETMVQRFAPNVGKSGLFLPTKSLQPVGAEVKFELRLADDKVVITGLGRVKAAKPPDPANPKVAFGMAIELMRVTRESREVILKMLARRKEVGLAEVAIPMPEDIDAARKIDPVGTGVRDSGSAIPRPMLTIDSAPVLESGPVLAPSILTAPRRPTGPLAVAKVQATQALAPEPPRKKRVPVSEVIERASGPIALAALDVPGLDADVDVASVVARARALAGDNVDAELEALRDMTAAPIEISVEAASVELAKQLGGTAIRRDRSTRWAPPPTITTSERDENAGEIPVGAKAEDSAGRNADEKVGAKTDDVAPPTDPVVPAIEAREQDPTEAAAREAAEAESREVAEREAREAAEAEAAQRTETRRAARLAEARAARERAREVRLARERADRAAEERDAAERAAAAQAIESEPAPAPEVPLANTVGAAISGSGNITLGVLAQASRDDSAAPVSTGASTYVDEELPDQARDSRPLRAFQARSGMFDPREGVAQMLAEEEAAPREHEVEPDQIADELHQLDERDFEEVEHTQVGVAADDPASFDQHVFPTVPAHVITPEPMAAAELERSLEAQLQQAEADEDLGFGSAIAYADPIVPPSLSSEVPLEVEDMEEINEFEILAEADAADADLLTAHGEADASGQKQAAVLVERESDNDFSIAVEPTSRPSDSDFASRLDFSDEFEAAPEDHLAPDPILPELPDEDPLAYAGRPASLSELVQSLGAIDDDPRELSAGQALSVFETPEPDPPRRVSVDSEDGESPYVRPKNDLPVEDEFDAPHGDFNKRSDYARAEPLPAGFPPLHSFDESDVIEKVAPEVGQPRSKKPSPKRAEPAPAKAAAVKPAARASGRPVRPAEPAGLEELETALEALDVDLDDLSIPRANTDLPGKRTQARTPSASRPISEPMVMEQKVPLNPSATARARRESRSPPIGGSAAPAPRAPRAPTDDGILIDFDDDE